MKLTFFSSSSGGKQQDITMSATYRMIHGLDEPPKPRHIATRPEGMKLPGVNACSRPSSTGSSLSSPPFHGDDSPVGTSPFSFSPENPMSPFSPPPRGSMARQGLSFLILQQLYDDQGAQEPEAEAEDTHRERGDSINEENDLNSSFSGSEGGYSHRSSSSLSHHTPGMI